MAEKDQGQRRQELYANQVILDGDRSRIPPLEVLRIAKESYRDAAEVVSELEKTYAKSLFSERT